MPGPKDPTKYPLEFAQILFSWNQSEAKKLELPFKTQSEAVRFRFRLYDYFAALKDIPEHFSSEMLAGLQQLQTLSKMVSIKLDKERNVLILEEGGNWMVPESVREVLKKDVEQRVEKAMTKVRMPDEILKESDEQNTFPEFRYPPTVK